MVSAQLKHVMALTILLIITTASVIVSAQDSAGKLPEQIYSVKQALSLAGDNAPALTAYLGHYKNDPLKRKAASFLVEQMNEHKFSYTGDIIHKYDTILSLFASLRDKGIFVGDPPLITDAWRDLVHYEGRISAYNVDKKYDHTALSSSFLIENTEMAFKAWNHAPAFVSKDFSVFCEYVLPYRAGNEPVENYRKSYYLKHKSLIDSSKTPEEIIKRFNADFVYNQQYRSSSTLWDHPLDFSVSQMELGRRGACRQLTVHCASVMRACGLPVAIDRAIWANRSIGHAWNVLLLDSNKILPFDAFAGSKIEFAYKPAKIFRKRYSMSSIVLDEESIGDIPEGMMNPYEEDVTDQYTKAYDVVVPVTKGHDNYNHKKMGVICVFDNRDWRIAHYGRIDSGKMYFTKMAADVAYLAAFYDNGAIVAASEPFLLREDGSIHFCAIDNSSKITMGLTRKYPMFKRIRAFAMSLRGAAFETSDSADFSDSEKHFSVYDLPFQVADSVVKGSRPFRYIRLKASANRNANFAEVEFYGKLNGIGEEVKLSGKIIGYPELSPDNLHPYTLAMDGNLETWFDKESGSVGWVGLDLGNNNKYIVTRVRFCPRSDTNFILPGDTYELKYWDGAWKSHDVQTAAAPTITFKDVPSGTLYILHNQSRGREERIFTFEEGKQIWW